MKQKIDTLIKARWIIPVEPAGTVLEHHALAVKDGAILAIFPMEKASNYEAQTVVDLPTHAVIPGLVNAHTHAAMSLFRGLADDLPLMEWLNNHIWPAEAQWVSAQFVRDGTALSVAEMLRGGITCFNDMYFFPEETARVVKDAGIRACIGLIVLEFPSAWAKTADEYLSKGLKLHDDLRSYDLITTAFAPHAPYTVSDAPLERIRTLADELDIPIHMHVHETADEVTEAVARSGVRPLERLKRLQLLTPRLLAVHMTQLLPEEIKTLAETGVQVLHCPESNLKLASGLCPAAALLKAGINVALGTDGAASNNDLDMLGEMRTAALLAKGVSGDATALPAHAALTSATLNGAKALGLEEYIGSLKPGKSADLTAIDLSFTATQPVYNPLSQIVYSATREQVTDVWVAGKRLLHNRRLMTLDEQAVLAKAAAWRDKIQAAKMLAKEKKL
ncbi:MAG TPA: TRZ/ATZ family hydrolase [Acidiferrobacterales bacterium]|nr:TRZ/ATZ family hydrolase [Acidiferrobacterales bacterium]